MNTYETSINTIKQKLAENSENTAVNVLQTISTIKSISDIVDKTNSETSLRLPYSTMPNLTSHNWK